MSNSDTNKSHENSTPGVSLQEIEAVITIIDLCAKRGAFEGSELGSVAAIREAFSKIATFHAQAAQTDAVDDSNDESAQVTEET